MKSFLTATVGIFIAASVAIAVAVGTVRISCVILGRGIITVSGFKEQEWQKRRKSSKAIV